MKNNIPILAAVILTFALCYVRMRGMEEEYRKELAGYKEKINQMANARQRPRDRVQTMPRPQGQDSPLEPRSAGRPRMTGNGASLPETSESQGQLILGMLDSEAGRKLLMSKLRGIYQDEWESFGLQLPESERGKFSEIMMAHLEKLNRLFVLSFGADEETMSQLDEERKIAEQQLAGKIQAELGSDVYSKFGGYQETLPVRRQLDMMQKTGQFEIADSGKREKLVGAITDAFRNRDPVTEEKLAASQDPREFSAALDEKTSIYNDIARQAQAYLDEDEQRKLVDFFNSDIRTLELIMESHEVNPAGESASEE